MSNYLQIFITMLSLLNPVLALSQYLDLTKHLSKEDKRHVAILAGITVFCILLVFLFSGDWIMEGLGIHTYSLRLGGGVILLILGVKIILVDSSTNDGGVDTEIDKKRVKSLGVSPIGLPMIVGPASMVMVTLYGHDSPHLWDKLGIAAVLLSLSILIVVILMLSDQIAKAIGDIGIVIISKIMGLIITAIAFEMIIAGIDTVLPIYQKTLGSIH